MNLLLLTTHLNTGGITSYLETLCRGLCAQNHQVWVVSAGGERAAEFEKMGVRLITLDIRTKSVLSWKIYRPLRRLVRLIKTEHIDCLHAQTRITQVMGTMLSWLTDCPLVTTCHGFFKPKWGRRLFPAWGDRVIAISPAVQAHLCTDFSVPEQDVVLVPNGIDVAAFPLLSREQRKQRRRDCRVKGQPIIGIIARLSDVKGHDVLLDAMPEIITRFPEVTVMIVGEGKMEKELRAQVRRLGISARVDFRTQEKRSHDFFPTFDVFVMPSRQEGLGLSVMEAQASGLPVVASRVGGLTALIQHGSTGLLVQPESPQDLAGGLIDVLSRLDAAGQMGLQAREYVQKYFSVEQMVRLTLGIYQHVVEE